MSNYITAVPTIPSAKDKIQRERIFELVCFYSQKIKNHVLNCKTFKKCHNSAYDIDCEICSKFLCFLDLINNQEKRINNEIDIGKMQQMGVIEHMILEDGIQLLE